MRYILLILCIVMAASASAQVQFLGSPTTTVRNRGNFVSDSLFYLPKRQKAPSDTGAVRYAIADSSVYVWTGYQWNKIAPGAFVAIGDTATMLNPYTRGSGTTNYLPKFTGTRTFGNSVAYDNGGAELLVNTTTDAGAYALQVAGSIYNTTGGILAATSGNVGIGVTAYDKLVSGGAVVATGATSYSTVQGHITAMSVTGGNSVINAVDWGVDYKTLVIAAGDIRFTSGTSGTNAERIRLKSDGEFIIDANSVFSDAGNYLLQVQGAIYNTTTLTTGAPTSGTAKPWKLGEAATVSPTSPNRTIRVEIDGTVYYIHAKTTND